MTAIEIDIKDLKSRIKLVESEIAKLTLHDSNHISWDKLIRPQTVVKVNVNKFGLVTGSEPLKPSDLPIIPMEQVDGLLKTLSEKENITTENESKNNIGTGGTACKITYNKYGEILSGTELMPSDIPILPSSNINGLDDTISGIYKAIEELKITQGSISDVTPGTYTKITYNSSGRVTGGTNLSIDDIPNEVMTSINEVKSSLLDYVRTKQLTLKLSDIEQKISADIKLRTDSIDDKILSLSSLCNELKSKIRQINASLENIVTQQDFVTEVNKIQQTVSTITTIKTSIDMLMTNYTTIKNENDRLNETVKELNAKLIKLEEKINKES